MMPRVEFCLAIHPSAELLEPIDVLGLKIQILLRSINLPLIIISALPKQCPTETQQLRDWYFNHSAYSKCFK